MHTDDSTPLPAPIPVEDRLQFLEECILRQNALIEDLIKRVKQLEDGESKTPRPEHSRNGHPPAPPATKTVNAAPSEKAPKVDPAPVTNGTAKRPKSPKGSRGQSPKPAPETPSKVTNGHTAKQTNGHATPQRSTSANGHSNNGVQRSASNSSRSNKKASARDDEKFDSLLATFAEKMDKKKAKEPKPSTTVAAECADVAQSSTQSAAQGSDKKNDKFSRREKRKELEAKKQDASEKEIMKRLQWTSLLNAAEQMAKSDPENAELLKQVRERRGRKAF